MVWMTGATMIGYYTNKESNTLCQESRGIFGGWFSRNNKVIPKEEKKEEQVSLDFNKIAQFPTGSFWDDLAVTAGQKVQSAIDTGLPTEVSYGFISGYCSGFAMKKVGKAAGLIFGLGFIGLQTLANQGYITVNHGKLREEVEGFFDMNKDGKIDRGDGQLAYDKLMEVLTYNLPSGSGFAAGFIGGIRSG
ncbi:hypothetical protein FisN_1Hh313 [Fistulifera solaris]|uniref:EF-hand domain-containing protein n=1 Tax=Fistulifera solaris TaxID=1519565 RepID=A0A1Z5JEI1_FISSO|nr:hypothetical protein FisN_1Hh313 [Fistulifera solaris]|eukprot:GAX12379.1 hypothetical protein FisN_1Hh313 [Fistulifera solaris]